GVVLLGQDRSERFGVSDGQVLQVPGPDGSVQELRVQVDANLQMSLVTPTTLEALVGDASTPVVMGDFADPGTPEREGVEVVSLVEDRKSVGEGRGGGGRGERA